MRDYGVVVVHAHRVELEELAVHVWAAERRVRVSAHRANSRVAEIGKELGVADELVGLGEKVEVGRVAERVVERGGKHHDARLENRSRFVGVEVEEGVRVA